MTAPEPQYGLAPRERMASMSGLDFLRAMIAGEIPRPPFSRLTGVFLTEADPGRVVFTGTPTYDFLNPMGSIHGGYFAMLLDSCLGCAVLSTLPAGSGFTTLEYKINLLRGMTQSTGEVRAEGTILTTGRRVATSEARLTDAQGRLLAHGTSTCLIVEA